MGKCHKYVKVIVRNPLWYTCNTSVIRWNGKKYKHVTGVTRHELPYDLYCRIAVSIEAKFQDLPLLSDVKILLF